MSATPTSPADGSSSSHNGPAGDIAIIGMAALFPGAKDLPTYWQNILNKVDAVREAPASWIGPYYDPESSENDRLYTQKGGFLHDVADFNPMEFGIMPNSVDGADPDHFLALKLARDALIDAGYFAPGQSHDSTGIILGRGTYFNRGFGTVLQHGMIVDQTLTLLRQLQPHLAEDTLATLRQHLKASLPPFTAEMSPGLVPNVVTGRIANRLNLMGPNYLIDAACSSSLIAVQLACQELLSGRCDLMLAGGVQASTPPQVHMVFNQIGALSHGDIRPFSTEADGTLLSEGLGTLVLKRLGDAERDGDRIYAVIKATGVSSDGKALGLLAPRLEGEVLALERAYANLDPATIGLVEAHGTGIPLGDKTEIRSLTQVFGPRHGSLPSCGLGSVKSMLGHCIPAAGVASMIKMALSLYHKVLPPTLCDQVNPDLEIERTPFYVNTELRPWIHNGTVTPRRAGVNAFGFGGINAHVVLEEAPQPARQPIQNLHHHWPSELLLFASDSRAGLLDQLQQVRQDLTTNPAVALGSLAKTLVQQAQGAQRLAIVAKDTADLNIKLNRAIDKLQDPERQKLQTRNGVYFMAQANRAALGKVAFLFPGEGSQYTNMLQDLCVHLPQVRAWFDLLDEAYTESREYAPSQFIFPPPTSLSAEARELVQRHLFMMEMASESVFISSMALNELLRDLAVSCDGIVGHSTGEYAAMRSAGVVPYVSRGQVKRSMRHMNEVYRKVEEKGDIPRGQLVAVGATDAATLAQVIDQAEGPLYVAMDNCPNQVVLCGVAPEVERAIETLKAAGAICSPLPFDRPYHTPLFHEVEVAFREFYAALDVEAGHTPIYSCISVDRFASDRAAIRDLAAQQWSHPVRFRETINRLYDEGFRTFIEVGPGGNLTAFVNDILQGREGLALASDSARLSTLQQLHNLLGRLWVNGMEVNLQPLYQVRQLPDLDLATLGEPPAPPKGMRLALDMPLMSLDEAQAAGLRPQFQENRANGAESKTSEPPATAESAETSESAALPPASRPAVSAAPVPAVPVPTPAPVAPPVAEQAVEKAVGKTVEKIVEPATAPTPPGPLLGQILHHDADRLVSQRRFDLHRDLFLHDHVLGGTLSVHRSTQQPDLLPLPVVPFTVTMELVTEAACHLVGGGAVPLGLTTVTGYRWLALDQGEIAVRVEAERLPPPQNAPGEQTVRVQVFQMDGTASNGQTSNGQASDELVFEGRVRLGAQPAPAPAPILPPLAQPQPSRWADGDLYTQGMFHGPQFQGVRHLRQWDATGIDADVVTLPQDTFLSDNPAPAFALDPSLLDAATQVVAFWISEQFGTDFHVFPFQIQAVTLTGPPLPPHTPLLCQGRIRIVDDQRTTEATLDFIDASGAVVARIAGLRSLYFDVPHAYYRCRLQPVTEFFSQPWMQGETGLVCRQVALESDRFLKVSGGIGLRALAHLMLAPPERQLWYALPDGPRRIEWLMGRIAAKDALRQWVAQAYQVQLAPVDVAILPDAQGQPRVVSQTDIALGPLPEVSISHKSGPNGSIQAVAAVGPLGFALGLDLEQYAVDLPSLVTAGFSPWEQQFLETAPAPLLVAAWAAKEAASKAMGQGLGGQPQQWQVTAVAEAGQALTVVHGETAFSVRVWYGEHQLLALCLVPLAPPAEAVTAAVSGAPPT